MFSSASTLCDNTDKNMKNAKQAISMRHRLLDSLVVECWHQVLEVPGSIPSQGPIDVIKMVPEVLSFSTVINVMDKIWDKKILRSWRSLAVVAGKKNPNDHAEPTKVKR